MAKKTINEINYWCWETSKFRYSFFYYDWSIYNKNDQYQKLYDSWEYYRLWNFKYPNISESTMIEWCEQAGREQVKTSNLIDYLNWIYDEKFGWNKFDDESLDLNDEDSLDDTDNEIWYDKISYEIFEAFNNFMERKKMRFEQKADLLEDIKEYLMLISYKKLESEDWYKSYQDITNYLVQEYNKMK